MGAGSGLRNSASPSMLHIRQEVQGRERLAEAPGCPPSPPHLPALVPRSSKGGRTGEDRAVWSAALPAT